MASVAAKCKALLYWTHLTLLFSSLSWAGQADVSAGFLQGETASRFSEAGLRDLSQYIEKKQSGWFASPEPDSPFDRVVSYPLSFENIEILVDNQVVYLRFQNNFLGEGQTKEFQEIVRYPDGERLALGLVKPRIDKEAQKRLDQEFKILGEIMLLPPENQMGLPITYSVGRGKIIQKRYDSDLFTAYFDDDHFIPSLTTSRTNRMDVLGQVIHGVAQLHRMGIAHSDVKPENVLLSQFKNSDGKTRFHAALADYDLAFRPAELIKNHEKRPSGGTPSWAAPEVFVQGSPPSWFNLDPLVEAKNIELSLKPDVYGLGLLTYFMGFPKAPILDWMTRFKSREFLTQRFQRTHERELNHLLNKQENQLKFNPLGMLVAAALEIEPERRITSAVFEKAFDFASHWSFEPWDALTPRIDVLRANRPNSILDLDEKKAGELLSSKKPGTFLILAVEKYQVVQVKIKYVGWALDPKTNNHVTLTKTLDGSPTAFERIKAEVDYLKSLGFLKEQIKEIPILWNFLERLGAA